MMQVERQVPCTAMMPAQVRRCSLSSSVMKGLEVKQNKSIFLRFTGKAKALTKTHENELGNVF